MEIARQPSGDTVIFRLNGRLDANWCHHVESALSSAVRSGEHRLHLDMASVSYISSAGLRVLLACYKQLKSIDGSLAVINPSNAVRSVLELSGLQMLITSEVPTASRPDESGSEDLSSNARYRVFPLRSVGVRLEAIGDSGILRRGLHQQPDRVRRFSENCIAIGIGALGTNYSENVSRFGEFLAVAGVAAFQPGDGSSRPDFMLSEGNLVPEGHLALGLCGEGSFSSIARFEATAQARTVGVTELAQKALELSGASAAVLVAVAETAGLVGATLRQSPVPVVKASTNRFGFPQIRDWLSFTGERAYRDSTSLTVGVVARPGTSFDALLRPLGRKVDLLGHLHSAAFPYRPLRKDRVELQPSVTELFEGQSLLAILHLLSDPRDFHGAGESEFYRGAVWISPVVS